MKRRMFFQAPSLAVVLGPIAQRRRGKAMPAAVGHHGLDPGSLDGLEPLVAHRVAGAIQKIERFGTLVRLAMAARTGGGRWTIRCSAIFDFGIRIVRSCKLTCSHRTASASLILAPVANMNSTTADKLWVGMFAEDVHPFELERRLDLLLHLKPLDP